MKGDEEVRDEGLYNQYIAFDKEYCSLCRALGRGNHWTTRDSRNRLLCEKHLNLYEEEVADIQGGEADFPPGLDSEKARERFLEDDTTWTRIHILEAMVEKGKISLEKARSQMKAVVRNLCDYVEHEDEIKLERQKLEEETKNNMLAKIRLY